MPLLPAVRAVDEQGQVIELRRPETPQEALDIRTRARAIASTLSRYASWLDQEAIRLLRDSGATAVVDAEGTTWSLGTENEYSGVDWGALRDALLMKANEPSTIGGAALAEKVHGAFTWREPEPPKPYWSSTHAKVNALEAIDVFQPIVRQFRSKTPRPVLRSRK